MPTPFPPIDHDAAQRFIAQALAADPEAAGDAQSPEDSSPQLALHPTQAAVPEGPPLPLAASNQPPLRIRDIPVDTLRLVTESLLPEDVMKLAATAKPISVDIDLEAVIAKTSSGVEKHIQQHIDILRERHAALARGQRLPSDSFMVGRELQAMGRHADAEHCVRGYIPVDAPGEDAQVQDGMIINSRKILATSRLLRGDFEGAINFANDGLTVIRTAEQSGRHAFVFQLGIARSNLLLGSPALARAALDRARQAVPEGEVEEFHFAYAATDAMVRHSEGRPAQEVRAAIESAIGLLSAKGQAWGRTSLIAEVFAWRGDWENARLWLEKAAASRHDLGIVNVVLSPFVKTGDAFWQGVRSRIENLRSIRTPIPAFALLTQGDPALTDQALQTAVADLLRSVQRAQAA